MLMTFGYRGGRKLGAMQEYESLDSYILHEWLIP
jgi:hypothetical protein